MDLGGQGQEGRMLPEGTSQAGWEALKKTCEESEDRMDREELLSLKFDIYEAHYAYATEYHQGQWSRSYALFGKLRAKGFRPGVGVVENGYDALEGADGLVILTDWQEFRNPDFELIASKLNKPVIFDGRNLYDPTFVKKFGFKYYSIGRSDIV